MNYSTLFTTIKGYLQSDFPDVYFTSTDNSTSTDFTSVQQINTFIQQAEERIYNTIQFPALRKNVTGSTGVSPYVACPIDFLSVYSMAVIDSTGTYSYLLNKDVNFMRESFPSPAYKDQPQYYALFGPQSNNEQELTFILGPTPDQNYTLELHYFYYPQSIVTATNTWLSDNFDAVLLYGALVEAYTFNKGEADMIAQYETKYKEALALAKRLGDGLERQDAYRSGQYRQKVT
jgi:hypothetical protein